MINVEEKKIASTEEMIVYVSERIQKDPKDQDLYLKMAALSLDQQMIPEAEAALATYENLKGSDPEADFLKARIKLAQGKHLTALEIAENLFLNGFESIDLHELLYHLYLEADEILKAIDQVNYAIEKNPANHEYFFYKAVCYMQNRDTANALISLETAINDGYRFMEAIIQYVDLLVAVDDRAKAIEAINLGLSIDASDADINTAYARLLKNQGQFRKAKDILFDILDKDSDHYKALSALSEVYLNTYSYDSVLFYSNQAIQLNGDYFPPYYSKAAVFEKRKNYYSALEVFSQVLDRDPDNPVALHESERIRTYLSYNQRLTQRRDSTRQAIQNLPKPVKKSIYSERKYI
jgi:tetratricopeptide (TPR) repeat protein